MLYHFAPILLPLNLRNCSTSKHMTGDRDLEKQYDRLTHTNTHSRMTHCCIDSDPSLSCSELTHQAQPTRTKSVLRFYPQLRNQTSSMQGACEEQKKADQNAKHSEPCGRFHSCQPGI